MVLGSGIRDPGSGIRKTPIPDPGFKQHPIPDPGSGSATLSLDPDQDFEYGSGFNTDPDLKPWTNET